MVVKRKRNARKSGGNNSKDKNEKPQTSDNVAGKSNEMDEEYVHYVSEDENENEALKKEQKQKEDDDDELDEDDDKDVEMGLRNVQEEESDVEVTLDFHDPTDKDLLSIEKFLESWTKRLSINETKNDLSTAICKQTRVGTTVKVDDEEAPIGFITCLNIRRHIELLKPLEKALLSKTSNQQQQEQQQFCKLLNNCIDKNKGKFENEKLGLLITERVVNIPPQIIPKLLEAIFCEIQWATEDEPTKQLREDYHFGWYLYITEAFIQEVNNNHEIDENSSTSKKKKTKKQRLDSLIDEQSYQFLKVEDSAWFKYASYKSLWPISNNEENNKHNTTGRTVIAMIIAAKNIPKVRKMVEEAVGMIEKEEANETNETNDNKDEMET